MGTSSRFYPNLYKDSVSLMTVSAQVTAIPGIEAASVVMASATNVDNLAQAGLGTFEVRPNDLVVAVSGTDEACAEALAIADKLLSAAPGGGDDDTSVAAPTTSIQMAVDRDPDSNLALISVPGDYAAAEAMKALRLGLDVMIFSDNVSPEKELALKEYAREVDLMVMGPDCGTSIVNGIPLGFANVVRRGPIGVVGASGTGTQEVTVRIHQNGSGVSQALGTGGHDLADAIGGISMLHGLAALDGDPGTSVIVLVSKPPSPDVAAKVLAAAEASTKPVVVIFLGADPAAGSLFGVPLAGQRLGAGKAAGPGPLEVVAPQPAGHVDHLADEEQAGLALAGHAATVQFAGVDAAGRDFGLAPAFGAGGRDLPACQAVGQALQVLVAHLGQRAGGVQVQPRQPGVGQALRQQASQGVAQLAARAGLGLAQVVGKRQLQHRADQHVLRIADQRGRREVRQILAQIEHRLGLDCALDRELRNGGAEGHRLRDGLTHPREGHLDCGHHVFGRLD